VVLSRAVAPLVVVAAVFAATALATTPKPTSKTSIIGNVKVGKSEFKQQGCGSCHMLAASGEMDSSGIGPDLDTTTKTYAQIVAQVTKGGHGMTPYKGVLSATQIEDVAAFVYTSAHAS
jgi:mono/diheme cytochrome c family protein